jgi:hypothetical protein
MILGIAGIIAFAAGAKFKNLARNIYGLVTFITKFISVLLLFHISYCSISFPEEKYPSLENSSREEVIPSDSNRQYARNFSFKNMSQEGGGLKNNVAKLISNVFKLINNVIENNSGPFIFMQVLCSSVIVILITFMSVIFSGISKAGYQMHCTESKEVLSIPGLGNFIDFLMHFLLLVSFILLILSFFIKLLKDGFVYGWNFVKVKVDKIPVTSIEETKEEIMKTPGVSMNSDVSDIFSKVSMFMNELPIMKAAFIISLSYYISQLFLRWLEDIISNNIVLLTSWKTRETECSDEPNKKSKTEIERGFVLFGNILLFIVLVLITILLVVVNIKIAKDIGKAISMGLEAYIQAVAAISIKLSYETVKKTITTVSYKIPELRGLDIKAIENEVEREIDKYVDNAGNIKPEAIKTMLDELQQPSNGFIDVNEIKSNVITSKKPKGKNINDEEEKSRRQKEADDRSSRERSDSNETLNIRNIDASAPQANPGQPEQQRQLEQQRQPEQQRQQEPSQEPSSSPEPSSSSEPSSSEPSS